MKKIGFILLLAIAYYAHGRTMFSESHLQKWVVENNLKSYSGDKAACDIFANDAVMISTAKDRTIEGRDNICNYLKLSAAALTVIQANLNASYDDFHIERSGFPWREAKVTYTESATITSPHLPPIQNSAEETVVVTRTFSGLKIKSITTTTDIEQ